MQRRKSAIECIYIIAKTRIAFFHYTYHTSCETPTKVSRFALIALLYVSKYSMEIDWNSDGNITTMDSKINQFDNIPSSFQCTPYIFGGDYFKP
ncbi:hypothetical protein FGO68_gene3073 [Halteria grandinella]|uniref:Uncharacterized protein n=1 Tax=Halteria grandinella TaxID=5974 RepID=A0A8J8P8Q4_HALGN|nr:hypothetical protein FGO68_gene3073 [Halteria grandinella]